MQDFLNSKGESANGPSQATPPMERRVDLCVLLPDKSKCTVSIKESSRTADVFDVRAIVIQLKLNASKFHGHFVKLCN